MFIALTNIKTNRGIRVRTDMIANYYEDFMSENDNEIVTIITFTDKTELVVKESLAELDKIFKEKKMLLNEQKAAAGDIEVAAVIVG